MSKKRQGGETVDAAGCIRPPNNGRASDGPVTSHVSVGHAGSSPAPDTAPLTELDIRCPACGAKPGEQCAGIVDAGKNLEHPHGARTKALREVGRNDLELARAKRAHEAAEEFRPALNAGPDEHLAALAASLVKLGDAVGLARETLVEVFTEIARDLPITAVPE